MHENKCINEKLSSIVVLAKQTTDYIAICPDMDGGRCGFILDSRARKSKRCTSHLHRWSFLVDNQRIGV